MSAHVFSSPVVQLCRELVRIPSPSGEEGALASFVAERMEAMGLTVQRSRHGDVLGIRKGRVPGPTLLLDAHLDTVPAGDAPAWTRDPFGGEIDGGYLWGRGAADTKGSLAAMLCAVEGLGDVPGTVVLSASVCEEDMTSAALGELLDGLPVDAAIVGEPTSLCLGVAQKGRAGVVLEARGVGAHTSRPELGVNAVYRMMDAVARIRALPLPSDPALGRGVCELIEIESEPRPSIGMVPHRCAARLALRLLPGETAASVLERIETALEGLEGITARIAESRRSTCTGSVLAMPEFVSAWAQVPSPLQARLLEALGTEPFAAPYTTNASAAAARGIPVFLLGPGSIEQAHTIDEWIALDQLERAVGAYATAIRTCLEALG